MAVIETWFEQDLQKAVQVQHLDGSLFSNNANGNRIGVVVYNNGVAASLSGTVSGYAVLPDGTTVPCTGSLSGNRASVLIPAAAYQPGIIFVSVFLTSGSTVTTLAAVAANVQQARTDSQVSPGSAVTDWTQTINAAMQSVVTANAANMAVEYGSLTYPVPVGKYTIYNDLLYRCITPIATAESWTASHWTRVKIADEVSDLKSAFDTEIPFEVYSYTKNNLRFGSLQPNSTVDSSSKNSIAIGQKIKLSPGKTAVITPNLHQDMGNWGCRVVSYKNEEMSTSETGTVKINNTGSYYSTTSLSFTQSNGFDYILVGVYYYNANGDAYTNIADSFGDNEEILIINQNDRRFGLVYEQQFNSEVKRINVIESDVSALKEETNKIINVENGNSTNILEDATLGKTYNGNVGSVYSVVNNGYRISAVPPIAFSLDTEGIITVNEGYRTSYRTIDPQTGIVIADSGWITANRVVHFDSNYVYGFSGGKNPDSAITISEYLENVSVVPTSKFFLTIREFDEVSKLMMPSYLPNFKAVNHRGYNTIAPENTLPAFRLSKQKGFQYVECDVRFTSDNVPVILHDATINRTARNSDGSEISAAVNIADITYEQALQYDFGIWKGNNYKGTKIPTLDQFVFLCKCIGLTPRIELIYAPMSNEQVIACLDIIASYDMLDKVELNCNWRTGVETINAYDDSCTIVWGTGDISASFVEQLESLKTGKNRIIINGNYLTITADMLSRAKAAKIPVELYTIDSESYVNSIPNYVSGVTSNSINFAKLLFDASIA